LRFRQVYGHVGDCSGRSTGAERPTLLSAGDGGMPAGSSSSSSRGGSLSPREANTHLRSSKAVDGPRAERVDRVCVVSGDIVTTRSWYGFLRNLSLEAGGGYRFLFTYPSAMQVRASPPRLVMVETIIFSSCFFLSSFFLLFFLA